MRFIDEIARYKLEREQHIQEKKDKLTDLKNALRETVIQIQKAEDEYKKSFDDKIFEKLTKLKGDKNDLEGKVVLMDSQIELMDIGICSSINDQDIKSQIDDYIVNELGLLKALEDVKNEKQKYIQLIENYISLIHEFRKTRGKINGLSDYMTEDTKKSIYDALHTYYHALTGYYENNGINYSWDIFDFQKNNEFGDKLKAETEKVFHPLSWMDWTGETKEVEVI